MEDFDEFEGGLESFLGLLGAALGITHPLVAACKQASRVHRSMRLTLRWSLTLRLGSTRLGAATIMRCFHAEMRHWLKELWSLGALDFVPVPDLAEHFVYFDRLGKLEWPPAPD